MSRTDRIYKVHEILRGASRPVPMRRFMEELEVTRNTVTRDFEYLRDSLGAPLEYCKERNGHQYNPQAPVFELPGFWMNDSELYALLAAEQLLESVQPGLMTHRLAPLRNRIRNLLGEAGHDATRVSERVQVHALQVRKALAKIFGPVAEATLSCKQIRFRYRKRSTGEISVRITDPQRLLHYRSNWYLLAHCQTARDLRLFSLDCISAPQVLEKTSREIPGEVLDTLTRKSFGIFGGIPIATACLKFTSQAAEWVADEQWHEDQVCEWREDGFYLQVPYSNTTELAMDILRYGPDVEVLGPVELREQITSKIRAMGKIY